MADKVEYKYLDDEDDDEEISDEEFYDKDSIFQRWRDSDGEITILTPELREKRKKIIEMQDMEIRKIIERASK